MSRVYHCHAIYCEASDGIQLLNYCKTLILHKIHMAILDLAIILLGTERKRKAMRWTDSEKSA